MNVYREGIDGQRVPEPRPSPVPRLALSREQAANAIGVSTDFLDEHVVPEVRVVRRGRRKLIPVAELERWIRANAALPLEDERSR
jgi:hypothetical protein